MKMLDNIRVDLVNANLKRLIYEEKATDAAKASQKENWVLDKEFEIIKTLGQGSFGIVRLANLRSDPKKQYAVKSIPLEKL